MKVIFMGTPAFAVPALRQLISSEHQVVMVYSQPPRPAGRGNKEQKSPIHLLAEENNIPVKTPDTLRVIGAPEFFAKLKADIAVVAAYGMLLPEDILTGTKYGCINIHPSLLPRWRGAAPIQRTIMAGDKETACIIMQMDKGLDTGDILMMERYQIPPKTTAGELHDIMAETGARLVVKTLDAMQKGKIKPEKQVIKGVTYAHKISKDDEKINWSKPATEIDCLIRSLNPRPGAYFEYNGEKIKIFEADYEMVEHGKQPGKIIDDKLTIACGKGIIKPLKLQRPGKNILGINDFLRGYSLS